VRVRAVVTGCLAAALAIGPVACGGGDDDGSSKDDVTASTLTVYSGLPLRGPAAAQSLSIVNAEKLALEDAGGRAGSFVVKYVSLDDSSGPVGWEPKTVSAAARKAAQDKTTIGYLGDLDSGASAISIPVLNEAGILQISPSNTAVGLTKADGADKGEPEKYYPSGKRTYGRVIPADDVQAAAQIQLQRDEGCASTFLVHANEFYGKGIADQIERQAPDLGLQVLGNEAVDTDADAAAVTSLVQKVAGAQPPCVFFGGRTASGAVALFTALHRALPEAKLFGADGVAETAFTGALPPAVAAQVHLTTPSLAARMYPPAGRDFIRRYRARFGSPPEPLAIFGYEAMSVLLQAIRDAGPDGDDKEAVTAAFFAIRARQSVLGTYSIDAAGDTSLRRFGAAVIKDGRLSYIRVIDPSAG
jgi:branched-chain amino acid transport system substrate-binding protein